jgi:hypothetical protein
LFAARCIYARNVLVLNSPKPTGRVRWLSRLGADTFVLFAGGGGTACSGVGRQLIASERFQIRVDAPPQALPRFVAGRSSLQPLRADATRRLERGRFFDLDVGVNGDLRVRFYAKEQTEAAHSFGARGHLSIPTSRQP